MVDGAFRKSKGPLYERVSLFHFSARERRAGSVPQPPITHPKRRSFSSDPSIRPMYMYRLNHCIRWDISKYLVQWDKEENFGRSQVGVGVTHANAAEWSEVVVDTQYQVRRLWPM